MLSSGDKKRPAGTCERRVNRGDSRWSNFQWRGRKVVDGLEVCGLHAKVDDKRAKKDAAMRAKWARSDKLHEEAKKLSKAIGAKVRAYAFNGYSSGLQYTGDFVVPGDWLRELAKTHQIPAPVEIKDDDELL